MSLEGRIVENELMRAALDAARIGLCVVDSGGQIVVLSDDVADKLGVKDAGLLIGQHYRSLLVPGLIMNPGSDLFSLDALDTSVEARLSRPNGTPTMLIFQGRTVTYGDKDRYRVLTVIDIADFGTTRTRFYELRRQLDALNMAVVVTDTRLADLPIISVNNRFEQMTGYPAHFAVGRNCRFLQGRENRQPGVSKLGEAIKRKQGCHAILKNFRKDGSPFQNELFISPVFDENYELTHYIGLLRELTDRTPLAPRTDLSLE